MGAPLPQLKPIRVIDLAERARFPVSLALTPNGSTIELSRFGDDIWNFSPYIRQECLAVSHKHIDWRAQMPDGRRLTDPAHGRLLLSAKSFVWSLFADPVDGRRRPGMSTLVTRSKVLLFLLRWMIMRGVDQFADLSGLTMAYAEAVKVSVGKTPSETTIFQRLLLLEDIHRQRAKLDDALQEHPWPQESIASLSGYKDNPARYRPKTDPIPTQVASELAHVAVDYVRNQASHILAARDAKETAMREKRAAGLGRDSIKAARERAVHQWGYENAYKLNTAVGRLRTACLIVIAMFSGMRESELTSIAEGCIARRPSRDGSCETIWLHGTIYKTGVRPKAWQVPPVVEEAVFVLEQITRPLREILRREVAELRNRIGLTTGRERSQLVARLIIAERHQDKLFLTKVPRAKNEICVLSSMSLFSDLRRFCLDHAILNDDGRPYPLHSHQFRRSYAQFIARAELGDLLTLRDHFGHWSLDMTVFYTDGASQEFTTDQELLDMVTTEKSARQATVIRGYLESELPLANGGHWLEDWRSSVRTAKNKEALIAKYAGSVTLNGTGHSWCVGNARGTGCGGMCVFEAPMCVDCKYGIIGAEHRAVWEGIRDQQREVLELDDVGESGRARAKHILDAAQTVLRRLDGGNLS